MFPAESEKVLETLRQVTRTQMKIQTAILVLLVTFLSDFQVIAKNKPDLSGSEEEVTEQIASDFPSGMTRDEVISVLRKKYNVPQSGIIISNVIKTPIEEERDGCRIEIYSWVRATIYEYRSIRSLFTKNYVEVQYNFDKEQKLLYFDVVVEHGPDI